MGKLKKIGIGFGIVILSFFVLVFGIAVYNVSTTTESQEKLSQPETVISEIESEVTRNELEENEPVSSQEKVVQSKIESSKEIKLDTEDLQALIVGFESYNKSVKMLLDMCVNVESETDFRLLGLLIAESGDDFLEITSGYGAVRNTLMAEGYGEHPVLGPLMNQSVILVDQMSTCMEVLAWEFGG